jgi:hypothetical protein
VQPRLRLRGCTPQTRGNPAGGTQRCPNSWRTVDSSRSSFRAVERIDSPPCWSTSASRGSVRRTCRSGLVETSSRIGRTAPQVGERDSASDSPEAVDLGCDFCRHGGLRDGSAQWGRLGLSGAELRRVKDWWSGTEHGGGAESAQRLWRKTDV